jgi:hypothetical protein
LDPALLRRAAAELESVSGGRGLLGALKGSELGLVSRLPEEEELQRLLMDLPDMAGFAGNGGMSGGSLVWRSDGAVDMNTGRKMRLEVRKAPEGETVYGGLGGGMGLSIGLSVGLSVGLGILHSPLFAILFILGSLGVSLGGARLLMAALASNSRKKARKLVDAICRRLGKP